MSATGGLSSVLGYANVSLVETPKLSQTLWEIFYDRYANLTHFSQEEYECLMKEHMTFKPILDALQADEAPFKEQIARHKEEKIYVTIGRILCHLNIVFADELSRMRFPKLWSYVEDVLLARGTINFFLGFPLCEKSIHYSIETSEHKVRFPLILWGEDSAQDLLYFKKKKTIETCSLQRKKSVETVEVPLERRKFQSLSEIYAVFAHLKRNTPYQEIREARNNWIRAEWVLFALEHFYEYETSSIWVESTKVVGNYKQIFLSLQKPFNPDHKWQEHAAVVVCDSQEQSWVFDLVLDRPLLLEDWKKGFKDCAVYQATREFSIEWLDEVMMELRAMHLKELTGATIDS